MESQQPRALSCLRTYGSVSFLCAAVYFLQGISEPSEGLIAQPVRSWLRQAGYGAGLVGWYGAALTLPWVAKPFYGMLTDFVPLFGLRRKSYLIAAHSAACLGLVAAYAASAWWEFHVRPIMLLVPLLVATIGVAFADVVIDAVMVEIGQRLKLTGRLQSIQWTAMYTATIVTGLLGGHLSQHHQQAAGLLLAALCAAVGLALSILFVREPKREEVPVQHPLRAPTHPVNQPVSLVRSLRPILVQMDYAAQVAPARLAGTVFALLTGLSNLSIGLATGWGGSLYESWAKLEGVEPAFRQVVAVGILTTASCWLLLLWFPRESATSAPAAASPPV
ncbi:MAG: hypothetical protein KatS3mg110_4655 [Pirellulaceae bacterium]|nr:MAG: hypothetical protein KatS3mg110_4655 [Pirellulaceae bacterium]